MSENLPIETIFEACVESYDQALLAQKKGAHRIELCADLPTGGLSPNPALVKALFARLSIPIMVMVRPRPGHFVYDDRELDKMKEEVSLLRDLGVAGVVFGCLLRDNTVDLEKTRQLTNLAKPMQVTFHKAFDETPDIYAALQQLLSIRGINRILTSGGCATAWEGRQILQKLKEQAEEDLIVLPAGSITITNWEKLHALLKSPEYHGRKIVGGLV